MTSLVASLPNPQFDYASSNSFEEKTALTPKPPPPPAPAEVADEKKKLTFRRSDSEEEEALEMNGFEHEVSKMGGNEGIINDFDDVSAPHGMNRSNESEKFVEKLSTYEPEPEEEAAVDIASHISSDRSGH